MFSYRYTYVHLYVVCTYSSAHLRCVSHTVIQTYTYTPASHVRDVSLESLLQKSPIKETIFCVIQTYTYTPASHVRDASRTLIQRYICTSVCARRVSHTFTQNIVSFIGLFCKRDSIKETIFCMCETRVTHFDTEI